MNKFFRHYLFILIPVLSVLMVSCGDDEEPILAPEITAVSPISGTPGTTVTITGVNLANASAVTFGAATATVTNNTATSITTTVPTDAVAGSQQIKVVTPGGNDTEAFTVLEEVQAATITAVDPMTGGVGTAVTITGTNFTDASSVKIGDTEITGYEVSETGDAITFTVPGDATAESFTGRFTVTTPAGTVTSAEDVMFTFEEGVEAATITAVDPTTGGVGTEVTITGTNFTDASSVKIGDTEITGYVVNATGDAISFTVPEDATAQNFTGRFTVTTPAGAVTSPEDVTFTFEDGGQQAVITTVSPVRGVVGTEVTITGANFTDASSLMIGNTAITGFTVNATGDAITFTVPENATTENFSGRFTVVTPEGEVISAESVIFTFGNTVTYLPFNGDAADASANNNPATLVGDGATFVEGKEGQALALANGAYATLPDGILSDLNAMTIATYVKLDEKEGWTRLWDFGTGTDVYTFLTVNSGLTNAVRFAIKNGGDEQIIDAAEGTGALTVGEWYHITVTIADGVGILYLNGQEIGRNESITITPADLGDTHQNYIGKAQFAADPLLKGAVDEFRIYDKALTPAEIEALLVL